MRILHASFECYPVAKVGGLADVVGALPKYQNKIKNKASVIIPFYANTFTSDKEFEVVYESTLSIVNKEHSFEIKRLVLDFGFELYLVAIPGLLDKENVYGYKNDSMRSIAFQIATLDWVKNGEQYPQVIHCHDHHTGLIPFLMLHAKEYAALRNIPTVFTIHNAEYQGQISYDYLDYIPKFSKEHIGLLDWDNCINPLASAIKCAWRVTTVSPNYMQELQIKANGLERLLYNEKNKCVGILNGIDIETWNPETDQMLVKNFRISTLVSGRKANKKWLCSKYDLDITKPLFSFIGRMVGEKGADLLPEIVQEVMKNTDANIFVLGSGHKEVEEQLSVLKEKYRGRFNVYIGYNEQLSHIIYAGTDFLLMPSRVEPCGLNQLYALRYGAIPIVRRTGGLKDTVIDIGDGGFGFCMDQTSVFDVSHSVDRAIVLHKDKKAYKKIQQQIMSIDHSWDLSAKHYIDLYKSLIN